MLHVLRSTATCNFRVDSRFFTESSLDRKVISRPKDLPEYRRFLQCIRGGLCGVSLQSTVSSVAMWYASTALFSEAGRH
jgi:hypothetical protein